MSKGEGNLSGLFVVFEGIDGSGKSTQIKRLADKIREEFGRDSLETKQPGGAGEISAQIRQMVLSTTMSADTQVLLFLADKSEHVETVITPALRQGKTVLCDRYIYSTPAYYKGKRSRARFVDKINAWATHGVKPHIVFYLKTDPKVGLARQKNVTVFEEEGLSFMEKVSDRYDLIFKYSGGDIDDPVFVTIDANRDADAVFENVWKEFLRLLPRVNR